MTPKGLRDIFVLVFLNVDTRREFLTPAGYEPDAARVLTQPEAFVQHMKDSGSDADIVMHDRDNKFSQDFDQTLKDAGLRVRKAAFRSPNTVAFVVNCHGPGNSGSRLRPCPTEFAMAAPDYGAMLLSAAKRLP